jgi:hypothetical protein
VDSETDESRKILSVKQTPKKAVSKSPFDFPNRLWESLVLASGIEAETKFIQTHKTYPIN